MANIKFRVKHDKDRGLWRATGRTELNCEYVIEENGSWESSEKKAKKAVEEIVKQRIKGHLSWCQGKGTHG